MQRGSFGFDGHEAAPDPKTRRVEDLHSLAVFPPQGKRGLENCSPFTFRAHRLNGRSPAQPASAKRKRANLYCAVESIEREQRHQAEDQKTRETMVAQALVERLQLSLEKLIDKAAAQELGDHKCQCGTYGRSDPCVERAEIHAEQDRPCKAQHGP